MSRTERRRFLQRAAGASLAAAALSGGSPAPVSARSSSKIKIGQIGTGHAHAAGKIATLRRLSDLYELVGVVEPDERLRAAASRNAAYRDVAWMSERELLESQGLQAVAVETEVRDLVPTAARCIAAGVPIHLDKPAGTSLPDFRRLLEEAQRRGLVVQMGYMFRYNPAFQFLFQAIRKGWLGRVFEAHGVISKTVDAQRRRRLAEYPGAMYELGCHLIDALVAALGAPDKVTPFVRRTRPDQDDLADNMLAVFEYPAATATIRSSLIEVEGQRRRQFVVCGDEGTVAIRPLEPPALTLTLAARRERFPKGREEVALPRLGGRYDGDFQDLARILRGEKAADYGPAHDLAVHEAVLRASGEPVE